MPCGRWLSLGLMAVVAACAPAAEPVDPSAYEDATEGGERATHGVGEAPEATVASGGLAGDAVPSPAGEAHSEQPASPLAPTATVVAAKASVLEGGPKAEAGEVVNAGRSEPTPIATKEATGGSVEVEMIGFEHGGGQVLVALWRTASGFPERAQRAFGKKRTKIRSGRARVVFDEVPPGPFAVVVHHDEDHDFQMDTGLMGIPQEGYGFSRDAAGNFGPPSFRDARVWLRAGQTRRVRIRMRY